MGLGFQGLDILTKSFVTPMIANAFSTISATVQNQLYPSQMYFPPPPEPWQYLPPPPPVDLPTSWGSAFHFLGSLSSIASIYVGIGAVIGVGATGCLGRRKRFEEESVQSTNTSMDMSDVQEIASEKGMLEGDPEKQLKQEIINIL